MVVMAAETSWLLMDLRRTTGLTPSKKLNEEPLPSGPSWGSLRCSLAKAWQQGEKLIWKLWWMGCHTRALRCLCYMTQLGSSFLRLVVISARMDIFNLHKIVLWKLSANRYIKRVCTLNIKRTFSFAKLVDNMLSPSLDKHPFPIKCLLNSNVIVQSEGSAKSAEVP